MADLSLNYRLSVGERALIYVDDKLPTHPKIFRAGEKLGKNGPAQALALFLASLAYAREHLTDGFVPDAFVASCGLVQTPQAVANVLSSRAVRLWHRVRGGYQIHDWLDWNYKASEIKEKRAKERDKKARQRAARNGQGSGADHSLSPGVSLGDSRARGTTYHVPLGDRTTRNTLEEGSSGVLVPTSKNKPPPKARRDSREGVFHADPTTTRDQSAALFHCAGRDHDRADDQRLRVERPHQGSTRRAGLRLAIAGRSREGTLERRACADPHEDAAATAGAAGAEFRRRFGVAAAQSRRSAHGPGRLVQETSSRSRDPHHVETALHHDAGTRQVARAESRCLGDPRPDCAKRSARERRAA